MTQGVKTIIYPVKDIALAKALFNKLLGTEPYADEPYYVGFKVGDQEVGLDPNGHTHGMTPYWQVDDIRERVQALVEAGAQIAEGVKGVGGGRQIASVRDADGNIIGLLQDAK
jgi:predicted enzyme related to lactoylglutathione lyase